MVQPHLYADQGRNTVYQSWFRSSKLVNKTLCEIGFGSGVLSLMALQCDPKHIVAYETNGELYEYAQWCLEKSGLNNKITLRNEFAKPQDISSDVDVIFHELISGYDLWGEGVFDFVKLPKPIIPSVYINEFYVIPLDYGLINSKERKSLPLENLGFSQCLSDSMQETENLVASEHKMAISILNVAPHKEQIQNYIKSMNEIFMQSNFVYSTKKLNLDVYKQHMRNSNLVGRILYDSGSRTVDITDCTKTVSHSMDNIELDDIEIVVPKDQLHKDYLLIAVARLAHNNNAIKCEMCTSWSPVGVWNFISSRQNSPRDLHIGYKNKVTYHDNIQPGLSVTE